MRQIKFRGKRVDNREWGYGGYYQASTGENRIITVDETTGTITDWNVQPDTVGQFTGLLDKNGKEIYEGDIITLKGNYPRVVLWDKMSWALMPTEYFHDETFWIMNLQHPGLDWWEEFADEFEVIGNIHDNPELLSETIAIREV